MEKLVNEISSLSLPSSMWSVHIHPDYEFVGIIHINIINSKLVIDKGILVAPEGYGFRAKIFLNGFAAYVPNVVLDITQPSELFALVYLLHDKNTCRNFMETGDNTECLKLVDKAVDILYCSVCQDKPTKVFAENIMEPYSLEVSDNDNILKPKEEDEKYCVTCNTYIPETDKINHKYLCKKYVQPKDSTNKEGQNPNGNKKNEALCNFCGKVFPSGYRIEEHMLTHTQEKPFRCKICHKTFSKNFNLKMHELTHSGDKPYICSMCGKSYTTSSNLRTHIISSHSNEKKHSCDICKMTFVYPRYLKLHMRKHTGERPFACSICGKKFSKNIHLTIHMRTHTGEKPHCCLVCGKGFTTTGGLGYHKRVHHKSDNA